MRKLNETLGAYLGLNEANKAENWKGRLPDLDLEQSLQQETKLHQ